jgi:membrane-bound lytic murein transglycosylase B
MGAGVGKSILSEEEQEVLEKVCQDVGVPPELVVALIEEESRVYGMGRRHGIRERFDLLLAKYCEEV